MSILHDNILFPGLAGVFVQGEAFAPVQVEAFPGLFGEAHLTDPVKGADVWCEYVISGFATAALLHAEIARLQRYAGQLTGTLIRDDADAVTIQNITYLGFQLTESPQYSAGGVVGWYAKGVLRWRQRLI